MLRITPAEPMTWVFVGDSITHGCLHTHGNRNYVEHCTEVLRWQTGRTTDVVINAGVSGWRVPDLLGDFDFRLARFIPDVVVLMLGTNDATAGESGRQAFSSQLQELAPRIRALGAELVLQVPPLLRGESSGRADMPAYRDAIRAVADGLDVPIVDHARDWEAHLPDGGLDEWLADDIHPNAAGHLRMARTLLGALGIAGDPLCNH
ncbi:MAG: SGNH/GDSL hydrolase family protein [Propionibacteriaceae bacterium]|nr:SGNH/GDSL hydrolase family protein [Propionibacteriaceae bacterium]